MRQLILILFIIWSILPRSLTQNGCGDALPPRLEIGMQVTVTPGQSNNLRDAPSTSGERIGQITSSRIFTVLDGPVCSDGFYWYQVQNNATVGWTVEGSGTDYWLIEVDEEMLLTLTASFQIHGDSLPCPNPRLSVGGQGYVIAGGVNRIRHEPATTSEQTGQIFGGTVFDVVEGFICSEGYNWWLVRLGNQEGWTVEGSVDDYFVEPFSEPEQASRNRANSVAWSPDGRWLAVGGSAGNWVFDTENWNGAPRQIGRASNSVTFSPHGLPNIKPHWAGQSLRDDDAPPVSSDVLAVALRLLDNREFGLSFYDVATDELLETMITGWEGESAPPPNPSILRVVYASASDRYAYIQGRWTYAELQPPEGTLALSQAGTGSQTTAMYLTPDGSLAVVLYATPEGGRVGIHQLRSPRGGVELLSLVDTELDATSIALSADGTQFVIGGTGGQIEQRMLPGGRLIRQMAASTGQITRMAYNADGDNLAVAADDRLYILTTQDGSTLAQHEIGAQIVGLAYSPDGTLLAVIASRQLVLLESAGYQIRHTIPLE
jgi:hypothetical protein